MEEFEFLVADRIRTLAIQFRAEARESVKAELEEDRRNVERSLAQWDAENPYLKFVPQAYSELSEVAELVRKLDERY